MGIKMMKPVLKINTLTKSYHGVDALSNISLALEAGKIYGLIGENGAGKTTLMRLVSGLSYPDSGSIELFGHASESELQVQRKRLGCMIEHLSLIPNMTAKDNLRFHRIMRGIPGKEMEEELLELVGLADTGKKKAKNFSLGMKQRLGIAVALISNPELLILDEPINGLDPIGVVEIRNLLTKLCEEKQMTILISSHNLPEMYLTATDYIIIHKGRIKQTLTLEQLEENCKHYILIECDDTDKLVSVLEMNLNTNNFIVMPDKTIKLFDFWDRKDQVAKLIYENGIIVSKFAVEGETLENYFISVIGGERNV